MVKSPVVTHPPRATPMSVVTLWYFNAARNIAIENHQGKRQIIYRLEVFHSYVEVPVGSGFFLKDSKPTLANHLYLVQSGHRLCEFLTSQSPRLDDWINLYRILVLREKIV